MAAIDVGRTFTTAAAASPGGPAALPAAALDLSSLAWVEGELRRSLEAAHKGLRRVLRETEALADSDVDAVDPAVLSSARQHLHQGAGVLDVIGLQAAAVLLRAGEGLVQRHVSRSRRLDAAAVEAIERASFALLDYVARLLAGHDISPLALFPQYRAVQQAAGADRAHPADLWIVDWRWLDLPDDLRVGASPPDATARRQLEEQLLALMKAVPGSPVFQAASERMSLLCARLGAGAQAAGDQPHGATLWKLAAAVFEAQACGLLQPDVHSKRVASRLLQQFRQFGHGGEDAAAAERLAQDLLFFCSQAAAGADDRSTPQLAAVRRVYGLAATEPVDYASGGLGRFDPAHVAQARKRVAAAKESWAALAAGETQRIDGVVEQFGLVGDSLRRLYPAGERLAGALQSVATRLRRDAGVPRPELAMEVATGLLHLDASLEDVDFDHPAQRERVQRLAGRIETADAGGAVEPLEAWMEELYRRVSDRQTIGSVVHELRISLTESEQLIDRFFREPSEPAVLAPVPSQLQAMRGVLSVLGLDDASQAVQRMREDVQQLVSAPLLGDAAVPAGLFDRLAGNLGALGFLIDMFSVQPQMAKTLFSYDARRGMLQLPMERPAEAVSSAAVLPLPAVATGPAAAKPPLHVGSAASAESPAGEPLPAELAGDAEMLAIFLEEAGEVAADARASLAALADAPDDLVRLTTLRRAFHTLKGSSRMIGLAAFGETAWTAEQVFNRQLADQQPADAPLQRFTARALDALSDWIEVIAGGRSTHPPAVVEMAAARDALDAERGGSAQSMAQPPSMPAVEPPGVADSEGFDLSAEFDWLPAPMPTLEQEPEPEPAPEPGLAQERSPAAIALSDLPFHLPSAADLDLTLSDVLLPAAAEAAPVAPQDAELMFGDFELSAMPGSVDEPVAPPLPPPAPQEAVEAPSVLPIEPSPFELSLDLPDEPFPVRIGPPGALPPASIEAGFDLAFDLPVEPDLAPLPTSPQPADGRTQEPAAEASPAVDFELSFEPPQPAAAAGASPEPSPAVDEDEDEADAVRQVGPLRIPAALFDIYVNEADDLSRRLEALLVAWSEDLGRPVGEEAAALAHSLAGSSATVGFTDLSQLARAFEHTLAESHALGRGTPEDAQLFNRVAERIRRLLHQFAGGFLKSPPPEMAVELAEREAELASYRQAQVAVEPELEPAVDAVPPPAVLPVDETRPSAAEAAPATGATAAPAVPEFGRPQFRPLDELPAGRVRVAAARADAPDADDDIDAVDAVDSELFPIFEEEARELLPHWRRACANGPAAPTMPRCRPRRCARCTRSRAVPGWPVRCVWARCAIGSRRGSSICWPVRR